MSVVVLWIVGVFVELCACVAYALFGAGVVFFLLEATVVLTLAVIVLALAHAERLAEMREEKMRERRQDG